MSIEIVHKTPKNFKKRYKSLIMPQSIIASDGGTFDSTAYQGSTAATLFSRHYFELFDDAGGPGGLNSCQFNLTMPNDYISGTNIKFHVQWTGLGTTGNCRWKIGLAKTDSSGIFGTDTDTEYKVFMRGADSSGTAYRVIEFTTDEFNGSSLSAGKNISIIILRESGHADDTIAADCYLHSLEVIYECDNEGLEV